MDVDLALRTLSGLGTPGLIRLLVGAGVSAFLPTDFPSAGERRVDTLVLLDDGRVLHLEWQSGYDAGMPLRMLWYWLLIRQRYPDREIVQVVVQVGGSRAIAGELIAPSLSFCYRVVDSRSIDPGPLLASRAVEDNILAILFGREAPTVALRAILNRLAALEGRARRDALARLLILAGLRGATGTLVEEVKAMPLQVDLEGDPYLADLIGRSRRQGMLEGRAEGEAAALIRLIEKRIGPVGAALRSRIQGASQEQIEAWFDRAIGASALEAIFGPGPVN